MGRRSGIRREGFLLLDKPTGWTSHRALQEVKRRLNALKGGHTGSLDPLATGLLPLCFGSATRLAQFLLDADKTYEAVLTLGVETDTYDADGRVTARSEVRLPCSAVEEALHAFRGRILQVPPMYSAIKQGGQPLYRRARLGEEVVRDPRPVTVHRLDLIDFSGDRMELLIQCSKGTYVRSIAHDLGRALGCGAHVTALRRVAVGGFSIDQAVSVDEVDRAVRDGADDRLLLPADRLLAHLPAVRLAAPEAYRVGLGQAVAVVRGGESGWVRIYEQPDRFLGVGWLEPDGQVRPRRMLSANEHSLVEPAAQHG